MTSQGGTRTGVGACALAALLSVVWPGLGHWAVRARFRRETTVVTGINFATSLVLMGIIAPLHNKSDLVELIADRNIFMVIFGCLAILALTRFYTAIDSAWQARPEDATMRIPAAFAAAVLVIVGVAPLAVGAKYVYDTDQFVEKVFGNNNTETAQAGALDGGTTVPGGSTAPTVAQPEWAGDRRINILLLGGDSGADRWSLRTDSMNVISIDPVTGDAATIAIPRNLPYIEFPPGTPLDLYFPDGFDQYSGLTNAVYTFVDLPANRYLTTGGDDAGAQAIKMAIAQFLGIPIQYYVLVDMAGFVNVVDALGGIDVYAPKKVEAAPNPDPNGPKMPAYFDIGWHHFTGAEALSYSRTRHDDSDYWRMARQRCVIMSITTAATPKSLALGLTGLLDAFGDAVHTDIPRSELPALADMVEKFSGAGGVDAVRSIQMTPPTIESGSWKTAVPPDPGYTSYPQYIRDVIKNVLVPGTVDIVMPDLTKELVDCNGPDK